MAKENNVEKPATTDTTPTPNATLPTAEPVPALKPTLISAQIVLKDTDGTQLEVIGYVKATGKFEAINKILQYYDKKQKNLKVINIPEMSEAKDVAFIIT